MMLNNERGCVLAAEVNGQVIGMCSGQLTVSTEEDGPASPSRSSRADSIGSCGSVFCVGGPVLYLCFQ